MGISCSSCGLAGSQEVTPLEEDPSQTPVQDVESQDDGPLQDKQIWQEATALDSLVELVCGTTRVCVFDVEESSIPGLAINVNYICGASFAAMIYFIQYTIMVQFQHHPSLWSDPLTFVDRNQTAFDASNAIHLEIAALTAEVRHPEESGYRYFALTFTAFMAVLLTKDVMQPVVILLNVMSDLKKGLLDDETWFSAAAVGPAFGMSLAVLVICFYVMWHFGMTIAANEDVASILGDGLGLYVCNELDNWVADLVNACALPMKTYWSHEQMMSKCAKKRWQAPTVAGAVFMFLGLSGVVSGGLSGLFA